MINAVDSVLTTMSGSYLNRWRLDSGEEGAWRDGLRGFSIEVLRKATNDARVDFPEWPPTLMEFRRYCVTEKRRGEDGSDTDQIEKYSKWARDKGLQTHMPNETVDEFQRRLVWQYERRERGVTDDGLSKVVAENRAANLQNEQVFRDALRYHAGAS